ncbi:flagellar basal body protein [Nocardioides sp. TF02-7]|uniref:flagellar basal body protein n=1 Tax=Nocardioides sp. TF02-7 TaxID=2917724 RepID=UPI001F06A32D|nr:flagellar basal body protein [Nocardioides sp. TF02-7]UMG92946.1 flagellar basal body protein [Nocardioides sp. TF02-7]
MSGSFGSISAAVSALRYQRVALDVAGNNLANAGTEGYVRRSVVASAVHVGQPAVWSRYEGYGDGVAVAGTRRHVDALLDGRVRREHAVLSHLQTTRAALQRVDDGIGEPGPNGVSAALLELSNAWEDLALDPTGDAARQEVLKSAATLVQAPARPGAQRHRRGVRPAAPAPRRRRAGRHRGVRRRGPQPADPRRRGQRHRREHAARPARRARAPAGRADRRGDHGRRRRHVPRLGRRRPAGGGPDGGDPAGRLRRAAGRHRGRRRGDPRHRLRGRRHRPPGRADRRGRARSRTC